MLTASLDFAGKNTQPVVAYGVPVKQWIREAFPDQIKKPLKVLSLVELRLSDSNTKTSVLCANHPSEFFYFGGQKPEWAIKITTQDLIAARWQILMAENWDRDPKQALRDAKSYWDARAKRVKKITAEQIREFGFGH